MEAPLILFGNNLIIGQTIQNEPPVGISCHQILIVGREGTIGDGAVVLQFLTQRQRAVVQNVDVDL